MAAPFVDTAKITVRSGSGGNGVVSFHREKYVAAGGHIFFPVEGDHAVSAAAGADGDLRGVYKGCCHNRHLLFRVGSDAGRGPAAE